jgi:hypothetical protein
LQRLRRITVAAPALALFAALSLLAVLTTCVTTQESGAFKVGHDFEIQTTMGDGFTVRALSERAQKSRLLPAGLRVVFKSSFETREYVEAAERDGFTFANRELLATAQKP